MFPKKAGTDNNLREAESEEVSQIKSEPEDGNCDDPGVENVMPDLRMLPAVKEEVVQAATTSSSPANVFPEEAGIDNNPREAESEDFGQIKSEPEDGNCDDPGVENVTSDLKMFIEVKEEVVQGATTSSSPANGADVLSWKDCDSKSDSQSIVWRGERRSRINNLCRFRCALCNFSGKTNRILKHHMKIHKGFRPLHCDVCQMSFERHDDLLAHRRTHPKETERKRTYHCWCDEQFTSLEAFKHHKAAHINKKPYGCNKCPKRFAYGSNLDRHMAMKHTLKLRCDRCGKGFLSSAWHKKHQASCCESGLRTASDESPEQQPRIEYVQFDEVSSESSSADVFSTESTKGTQTYLDSTPPRDAHEKPFGCIKCPKRFAYGPNLRRHIVDKHTQNFRCDRCGKGFVSSARHKKHQASCCESILETASDKSPEQQARMDNVQFEELSSEPASAEKLSTRSTKGTQTCLDSTPPRKAHTQNKPFGCIKCPKRFALVASLSRHVVNKHTQNLQCDRCGKGFVSHAWHKKHQASCCESGFRTAADESPEQQARIEYAQFEELSSESASADVLFAESTTGTQTCLDSTPSREDYATESVGAGQAYVNSVPVDSCRNGPKVDEMSPLEKKFSIDFV